MIYFSFISNVINWKIYAEMYQVDAKKIHAIDLLFLKDLNKHK